MTKYKNIHMHSHLHTVHTHAQSLTLLPHYSHTALVQSQRCFLRHPELMSQAKNPHILHITDETQMYYKPYLNSQAFNKLSSQFQPLVFSPSLQCIN